MSMILRNYRIGDAGYIAYRHGILYDREYGLGGIFEQYVLAGLLKFLENPVNSEIWVAESDGRIAGFIAIIGVDEQTAQLRWFLIEPEFRGGGLGRRLMAEAVGYCRRRKFAQVFLWTFKGLDAARHLYKSFGFVQTEEKASDDWKDGLTEERWELNLPEA